MQLQDLQAEFKDALFSDNAHLEFVTPTSRMSIYKNNALMNLINALINYYPLITKLIGDESFKYLAREYSVHYPSRSSNLHHYGEYFSDFIKTFGRLNEYPYLPEVAEFEWACHTIYSAIDADGFTLDHDNYFDMQCTLHPASKLIAFKYPILDIIELCQGRSDNEVGLSQGGVNLLIIRRELDIKLAPLSQADFVFLECLQNNSTIQSASDEALAIDPSFNLSKKLTTFLADKTIINIFD